jgi:transposase-like protein
MQPNKQLTSGFSLQIPMSAIERNRSHSASAEVESPPVLAAGEPASDSADFATPDLSKEQVIVLRAIANGRSISAAAREAGVNRCTVHRWHHEPQFQHWLGAWQSQTKESGRNIMLTLIERSARIVERALDKDDLRVALTLLTKLGVLADKELPALSSVEGPAVSSFEQSGHRASGESSGSPVTPTTRALPNSKPTDLKELRGMINELETKFGDMLPGGRR